MAIERALLYDVCAAVEDPTERAGCELDKALVRLASACESCFAQLKAARLTSVTGMPFIRLLQ